MSPKRKTLVTYGERGKTVRVLVDHGRGRVLVQWFVKDGHGGNVARKRAFPDTPNGRREAKAFGQELAEQRESARRRALGRQAYCRSSTGDPAAPRGRREPPGHRGGVRTGLHHGPPHRQAANVDAPAMMHPHNPAHTPEARP